MAFLQMLQDGVYSIPTTIGFNSPELSGGSFSACLVWYSGDGSFSINGVNYSYGYKKYSPDYGGAGGRFYVFRNGSVTSSYDIGMYNSYGKTSV